MPCERAFSHPFAHSEMSAKDRRRRKLEWFDHGAAAFERTYPGAVARQLGADAPPVYVCPICRRGFLRQAVLTGELTAEDVPPRSVGGRPLVLTCKVCNNTAGTKLDASAQRKESVLRILRGEPSDERRVRVTIDGVTVEAGIAVENGATLVKVRKEYQREGVTLGERVSQGTPLTVNFYADAYSELGAKISWLRAGYLTMFAVFGYPVVFAPAMQLVRRQIREPDTALMRTFTIEVSERVPLSMKRLLRALDPSLNCWAVQFGRYCVLLPQPKDVALYDRLAARAATVASVHWQSYEFPARPCF